MKCKNYLFGFFCIVIFVVFFAGPPPARSTEVKKQCLWSPASGKGGESKLTVVVESGKKVEVAAPDGCGKFTKYKCTEWTGPKGAEAVHFRAFKKKGGRAFEAFFAVEKDGPKLVWSGVTGLAGEFGERKGLFLDYEPPAKGSKNLYPILYSLDERVQLCGFGMVPLDVGMYDPKSASFRPVVFDRLRRWKRKEMKGWGQGASGLKIPKYEKPVGLEGKFKSSEEGGEGVSFGNFLIFESSSSTLGGKGKALVGVPPSALTDGNPGTGWVEGSGGAGSGEFVTAKSISSYFPIKALELSLAKGDSKKEAKKLAALKKFTITMSGGQVFVVNLAGDPRKFPEKKVVVEFPEPVETKCLSIIIDDVWPAAASSGSHTFIGEVKPETSVTDSGKFAKLADSLYKAAGTVSLEKILSAIPPQAASTVAGAWDSLDDGTRSYLIDHTGKNLLQGEGGSGLAEKQLEWIIEKEKDHDIYNLAFSLEKAPLLMLEWFDAAQKPEMKEIAAVTLHMNGYDDAAKILIDFYLKKDPPGAVLLDKLRLLSFIQMGFERMLKKRDELVQWELDQGAGEGPAAPVQGPEGGWCNFLQENFYGPRGDIEGGAFQDYDAVRMIGLLYALQKSSLSDCAAVLAARMWESAGEFETKYYILDLFKKLVTAVGCPQCSKLFQETGIMSDVLDLDDVHLKVAALEVVSLSAGIESSAAEEIKKVLDDPSPLVRVKAVEAFSRLSIKDKGVEEKILHAALEDFWPEVRKEAVMAAFKIKDISEEKLLKLLSDPSPNVKKHAIRLVVDRGAGSQAVGKAMIKNAAGKKMRWDVKEEAALAIGKLCIVGFEKELERIIEDGLYPDSTEAEIAASAGAIASLGMLGWKDAVDVLILAVLPGIRSEIRLSAIEALGSIGGEEALNILKMLAGDLDKAIRGASEKSLEDIKNKKKPACK